jgi:hypothetical protein
LTAYGFDRRSVEWLPSIMIRRNFAPGIGALGQFPPEMPVCSDNSRSSSSIRLSTWRVGSALDIQFCRRGIHSSRQTRRPAPTTTTSRVRLLDGIVETERGDLLIRRVPSVVEQISTGVLDGHGNRQLLDVDVAFEVDVGMGAGCASETL